MNILTKIRYDYLSTEIEFPINDDELETTLKEAGMPTDTTSPFVMGLVSYPKELMILEGTIVNLDELNYLAKWFDSIIAEEYDQFCAALKYEKVKTVKDMINLTFNLDKYTLITDISDMAKVGRDYVLNTEGSIPVDSKNDEKFAQIGRDLLGSGRGIFTEKGLLFVENKPIQEVYDGQVFPSFAYNAAIADVKIEYRGKLETVFLPDSNLVAVKALNRLGAPSIEDCECCFEILDPRYSALSDSLEEVFKDEGIYQLNHILKQLDECCVDAKKLASTIEYANVSSSHDIDILIENLDEMELIEDVNYGDDESVGRYFIENDLYEEYIISEDLQDFFDFGEFGKYMADVKCGEYVPGGFLFYDGSNDVSEILDQLDSRNTDMRMGGM